MALVVALLVAVVTVISFGSGPREPVYNGRKLTEWLADLRSQPPRLPSDASFAIRQMGTNAAPFLIGMLNAKDSAFKTKCMDILGRQRLVDFHFRYDFQKRGDALRGLAALGPDGYAAIPHLARLLNDPLESQMVAYTLSQIGSNAVPTLQSGLTNRNEMVRSRAAMFLGVSQDPGSVSNLLAALKDPDFGARSSAAHALTRFPQHSAIIVPALVDCLDDPDNTFRCNAARALLRFGEEAKPAIPKLLKMVESTDYHVSTTAAGVLMKLDFEGTLAAFTNNLESADVNVRRTTAWAFMLFKSTGKPAVPALVKCLKDPDSKVRQNAAVALRDIGEEPEMVVPALMANLTDPDLKVRNVTAIALGIFGERAKPAVPAIIKLLEENKGDDFTLGALYNALDDIDPDAARKINGQ